MPSIHRRRALRATTGLLIAAATLGPLATAPAWAQGATGFPSKPVKLVVPFPPGGLADNLTRGLGQELSKAWGQPVVVENKPGANTIIASDFTAKSPADGYTLLMANDPSVSSNQYLYSKLPYDPVKDLVPVINVAETLEVLVVSPALKAQNLNELLAAARARPGAVRYGSYGPGSKAHLDGAAFAQTTGTQLLHVPYKGVADVVPALLAGHIDMAFTGVPPVMQLVRSGQLRALAVAAPRRATVLPDVPTTTEAGLKDFHASAWFGLVAPAGVPRPVIDRIAADVSRIIRQPEFQQRYITGVGLELLDQGPDAFAAFLQKDRESYAKHIRDTGVKLD